MAALEIDLSVSWAAFRATLAAIFGAAQTAVATEDNVDIEALQTAAAAAFAAAAALSAATLAALATLLAALAAGLLIALNNPPRPLRLNNPPRLLLHPLTSHWINSPPARTYGTH